MGTCIEALLNLAQLMLRQYLMLAQVIYISPQGISSRFLLQHHIHNKWFILHQQLISYLLHQKYVEKNSN